MPGPPTPVSACPLKRLELHNGVKPTLYDSTHPSHALSLTIDRETAAGTGKEALVLLVHCGAQRMLSIRLTDILDLPKGASEAITIDKRLQQIRIRIQEQNHTVLADFQETRDFNVAICVLQRSGFHMKDHLNHSKMQVAGTSAAKSSLSFEPADDLGPRLSSITQLPDFDLPTGLAPVQEMSFSTLKHHQTPSLSDSQSLALMSNSQYQPWPGSPMAGPPSAQPQSFSQMAPHIPHLNPYNFFLGRANYENYRPRVSSPLRTSFHPGEMTRQLSVLDYNSNIHSTRPNQMPQRATSLSIAQTPVQRELGWPSNYDQLVPYNHDNAAVQDVPTATVTDKDVPGEEKKQSGPAEEFRRMLPQPRSLPFVRSAEKKGSDGETNLTETIGLELPAEESPSRSVGTRQSGQRKPGIPGQEKLPGLTATSTSELDLGTLPEAKKTESIAGEAQSTPSAKKRKLVSSKHVEPSPAEATVKTSSPGINTRSKLSMKRKVDSSKQVKSSPAESQAKTPSPGINTRNSQAKKRKAGSPKQVESSLTPARSMMLPPENATQRNLAKKRKADSTKKAKSSLVESQSVTPSAGSATRSNLAKKRKTESPKHVGSSPGERQVKAPSDGATTRNSSAKKRKINSPEQQVGSPRVEPRAEPPSTTQGCVTKESKAGSAKQTTRSTAALKEESATRRRTRNRVTTSKQENTDQSSRPTPRTSSSRRNKKARKTRAPFRPVNAECQTGSETPASSSPFVANSLSSGQKSDEQLTMELPILITDSMLQQVNEATAKILDQYELEIRDVTDEEACAQSYLDQLMTARRDFWYAKLSELEAGSWLAPV